MKQRIFKVCFVIFALVLLCLFFSSNVNDVRSQNDEFGKSEIKVQRNISQNVLDIEFWVFLAKNYEFIDVSIRNEVMINITADMIEPLTKPHTIFVVIPFSLSHITDLPSGAYYTYGFWLDPPVGVLNIHIPANISYFSIKIWGDLSSSSILWRNVVEIPFLHITSTLTNTSAYQIVLVQPPSRLLRVYSRFYPDISYQETSLENQRYILLSRVHPRSPVVLLYEHTLWETYAIALMFVTILIVFLIPYALKSNKTKAVLLNSKKAFWSLSPKRLISGLKRLYKEILKVNSSKLLKIWILCALLMVSLSFAGGPDPRLKIYVLSSTPKNAEIISDFVTRTHAEGVAVITVFDERNEFKTLADLGVVSLVVIGDFYPPTAYVPDFLERFIYPALDIAPQIVILQPYAYDVFALEVLRRYSEKAAVAEDLPSLVPVLWSVSKRANPLGLNASFEMYSKVAALVGLFSFIIVFLGLAFFASKLIELGKRPGVSHFVEAIVYAVVIFVFNQMVYVVCAVLLAMPLGLHTSSPKVTAIGFIGLGGGTRPRMLAGLAGFLFGAFLSIKEGLKFDKVGLVTFMVIGFFILVDPLTSGVAFYEFVLLFTTGPTFETAVATYSYVKEFLGRIGIAFGGWISPSYGISTGIMLYFVGAIPMCLFSKLKRSSATLLLLFSAFSTAQGVVRIADMMPMKTLISIIPGITVGFIVAGVFGLISLIEKAVRTKLGKV